jgi:hypothetical protein
VKNAPPKMTAFCSNTGRKPQETFDGDIEAGILCPLRENKRGEKPARIQSPPNREQKSMRSMS